MSEMLDRINGPEDLRRLSLPESEKLSQEIRECILDTVSKTGGHLAANLGVVELTVAMLQVFNLPADRVVWDVSHQTYAFKILTGRKDRFHTLRQFEGISGFTRRDESSCDAFGAGHSGTAISAALGMAVARDRRGGNENVVAVLGDGSVGCGISFEGFNNITGTTNRFIVILNDNEMSISENVGAMSSYLGNLLSNPRYNRWKRQVEGFAARMKLGWLRNTYYRLEEAIKSLFLRNVLFEEFGLRYIGPIDGHNLHKLQDALTIARESDRPIIVHVSTQKGKGFSQAEEHPERWHGVSGFDPETGEPVSGTAVTYSSVFGSVMEKLAADDKRLVAITAAMASGTGLSGFAKKFPDRFFDVGISEEHAVVFAAGMSAHGLLPVFAVYSTFFQRAVDCLIHDVCLQNLPVVICLDRAGIVGDDGPTHHGVFDIALLRPVPGLIMMQPKDAGELANMMYTAMRQGCPVVIRYPRGAVPGGGTLPDSFSELEIGKAEVLRPGREVQIWALGDMIPEAKEVAEILAARGIVAGLVNPRFIKPLDTELLSRQQIEAKLFVTIENGVLAGGFGSGVEEWLSSNGFRGKVLKFGWPDVFVPQGAPQILKEKYGLTAKAMAETIAKVSGTVTAV